MKVMLRVFSFDLVSKVMLGLLAVLVIRFMPEAEYARYTLALAVIAFVTHTLTSAFNTIHIIGYERLNLKKSLSGFLGVQLIAVAGLMVLLFPFRGTVAGLYWFIGAVITATCFSQFSKAVFRQELRFDRFSLIEFSRSAAMLGITAALIYFLRFEIKAWQVLLVQALALLIIFVIALRKRPVLRGLFRLREATALVAATFSQGYRYLFGYFALLALIAQMGVFILETVATPAELATYGSAFRYYILLLLALNAVSTVLLPVIKRAGSAAELDKIFAEHRKMMLVFTPVVLLGAWASQWIIPWIDMGRYPDAVPVFQVLAISAILSFAFSPHSSVLMRFEDFRFLFLLMGTATILAVGLNLVLIHRFGAAGAAGANLLVFAFINGSTFLRARRHRDRASYTGVVGKNIGSLAHSQADR